MTAARCPTVARPAVGPAGGTIPPCLRTVGAPQRGSGFSRRAGAASLLIPHPLAARCGERRLRILSRPDANSGPPARVSGVARRSASDAVLCQSGLLARGCCTARHSMCLCTTVWHIRPGCEGATAWAPLFAAKFCVPVHELVPDCALGRAASGAPHHRARDGARVSWSLPAIHK
jgi:hypothetical protein